MSISLGFEIRKKLSEGQKDFKNMDLKMVYLERVDLSHTNLEESDLSYANLKDVNLSCANLKGAYLERANLTDANLSAANLRGANLQKACLIGANLRDAELDEADLSGARLSGANLHEALWTRIYYDNNTEFGAEFDLNLLKDKTTYNLDLFSEQQITIEKILRQLNVVYKSAKYYLGNKLATKYLHDSKPNLDWLKGFEIARNGEIIFTGALIEHVGSIETKLMEKLTAKWIADFTKNCAQIIPHFSCPLDREQDK
ncbi:putative low-complexity protein [Pleurocapsa sp. PCC 7327]|uniref:pentapeptide repeat-containing protein n=1 Tax=Pleurocapsa sp. PCC 7327 TaxID=118163 RepID=UPI00029FA77F|nr:pentapeptide repeat-containing protein [Pleurocapsa sp. PCC 7327]AFY79180.1 putative low-complexity protein [Pleurocapsa sp. PCC 7327]